MAYQIYIDNGTKQFSLPTKDGITLERGRQGGPSKLVFTAIWDPAFLFFEGNVAVARNGEKILFFGYIFKRSPEANGFVSVTAYDQIRYLKYKDTYVLQGQRADQFIRKIAADRQLKVGTLRNTAYVIDQQIFDNKTLIDMVQTTIDLTYQATRTMLTLYDDGGSLCLQSPDDLFVNHLIDHETAQDLSFEVGIDGETYNRIKLYRDNEESGTRDVWVAEDKSTQQQWGILQYYESVDGTASGQAKADALLKAYNAPQKSLKVSNVIGHPDVRGGSLLPVQLTTMEFKINGLMVVDKVTHNFYQDQHTMDLELIGGGIGG